MGFRKSNDAADSIQRMNRMAETNTFSYELYDQLNEELRAEGYQSEYHPETNSYALKRTISGTSDSAKVWCDLCGGEYLPHEH